MSDLQKDPVWIVPTEASIIALRDENTRLQAERDAAIDALDDAMHRLLCEEKEKERLQAIVDKLREQIDVCLDFTGAICHKCGWTGVESDVPCEDEETACPECGDNSGVLFDMDEKLQWLSQQQDTAITREAAEAARKQAQENNDAK